MSRAIIAAKLTNGAVTGRCAPLEALRNVAMPCKVSPSLALRAGVLRRAVSSPSAALRRGAARGQSKRSCDSPQNNKAGSIFSLANISVAAFNLLANAMPKKCRLTILQGLPLESTLCCIGFPPCQRLFGIGLKD